MGKRKSLKQQVRDMLYNQCRFGESKHKAKQQEKVKCKASGERWNPSKVPGVFSGGSMQTYIKQSKYFAEWLMKNHPDIKDINTAKKFVNEYLVYRINREETADSLNTYRSTLRKLYQDDKLAGDIKFPRRLQDEISRSRGPKVSDKEFSEERNQDFVKFCKATGCRRSEIKILQIKDVLVIDGKVYITVYNKKHREEFKRFGPKGGRQRLVSVLGKYNDFVIKLIEGRDPEELIFKSIPSHADVHGYRREYAQDRYAELAGQEYTGGKADDKFLKVVMQDLGHNRTSVAKRSYLR